MAVHASCGATSPTLIREGGLLCIGSLSICDSIAWTAAFAFADGGRIQRRLARTADLKLYQLKSIFHPPRFLRNLETYRGRVVRELLSHYNNDPLQLRNL